MGNINLVIEDEIEQGFRQEVAKRLGMKKGNIKIAIEEAIQDWISKKG